MCVCVLCLCMRKCRYVPCGEKRSTSLRCHSLKHQPSYLFDFWVICIFDFIFYCFFFSFKIYHVRECEGGSKNSTFDLLALELSAIVRRPRWAWKINWVLCWVQALRSWAISLALLLSSLILPFHVIISIFHYKKRSVFLWFPPLFIYFIADYLVS